MNVHQHLSPRQRHHKRVECSAPICHIELDRQVVSSLSAAQIVIPAARKLRAVRPAAEHLLPGCEVFGCGVFGGSASRDLNDKGLR